MKKLLLTLGTIASIAAPVAAVVACSPDKSPISAKAAITQRVDVKMALIGDSIIDPTLVGDSIIDPSLIGDTAIILQSLQTKPTVILGNVGVPDVTGTPTSAQTGTGLVDEHHAGAHTTDGPTGSGTTDYGLFM